eukprot:55205_1
MFSNFSVIKETEHMLFLFSLVIVSWHVHLISSYFPNLFEDISTEQGIDIGWIQIFSCREGYGINNQPIFKDDHTWEELLPFTHHAIAAQILSNSAQPSDFDFTNNPSDYFAVMTDICSNPVLALNNERELSWVIDINTLVTVSDSDLNNWLGSSVAKNRLRQNTVCTGCSRTGISLTKSIYHACCNNQGIHINFDWSYTNLPITEGTYNCQWDYRTNLANTDGISFWIGFDISKEKCCKIRNNEMQYVDCNITFNTPHTTQQTIITSDLMSTNTETTSILSNTPYTTLSIPTTTLFVSTITTTEQPHTTLYAPSSTTEQTHTTLSVQSSTTTPTKSVLTSPTTSVSLSTVIVTPSVSSTLTNVYIPSDSLSVSTKNKLSIKSLITSTVTANSMEESYVLIETNENKYLYALLITLILLLIFVIVCFGYYWLDKIKNSNNGNDAALDMHIEGELNNINIEDIETNGSELKHSQSNQNEGIVTINNNYTNSIVDYGRTIIVHSNNITINSFPFQIGNDLDQLNDETYIKLISSIKSHFHLLTDRSLRLYEKINGSKIDIDDIMDLIDAFEANEGNNYVLNVYFEIKIYKNEYCGDGDDII